MTHSDIAITADSFALEVLESTEPVLVDFWAPWCGPCRVMNPIISKLAEEYAGSLKVGKINVDEAPDIATDFHIMAIPTLLLFQQGKVVERLEGLNSQEKIVQQLERLGIVAKVTA